MTELKITFLGTGSARPTPRRGVASVYVQLGGDAVQFDCGEGSQMQILRAGVRASRLVAMAITHFHGDHVNGLPGALGTMGLNGYEDGLTLIGPAGIDRYLAVLADLQILRPAFPVRVVENDEAVLLDTGAFTITGVRLRHRLPTHGYVLREHDLPGRFDLERARALGIPPGPKYGQLQRGESVTLDSGVVITPDQVLGPARPGRSVAYISDTRPSDRVVEAVHGVDVLIHEATYLHSLAPHARERGHSTVREAAEIARAAGVKRLFLTHISSKHPNNKELLAEATPIFEATEVAEDLMAVDVPLPA
ncbi:MAG: ribonuclease Z [Myxococcales bacterium]|nr:ribonuclease Z [Myxococcales bacterium]MCB9533832.1 ribonuclease Z [Myxococcales bacterium]